MDNFDKIIIALAYHTNVLRTLIPEISTFIANEDIAVNFIPEDIAVNLMQQAAEERTKAKFTQKEKWFKENWNFEYKPRIDEENKTNLQQHKDLESGSRKSDKIPRDFFLSCTKEKVRKKLIEALDLRKKDSI